jgi:hypothetical protein
MLSSYRLRLKEKVLSRFYFGKESSTAIDISLGYQTAPSNGIYGMQSD